jgi:hypothetical protein
MKKQNLDLTKDYVDLEDFINELWKEKNLIMVITIILSLFAYSLSFFQTKEFSSQIII